MNPDSWKGQQRYEKNWLQNQMGGFNATDSEAWQLLTSLYGPKISKDEIIALGQVCAIELKIDLVREYKRRKETMIKWFQNNLAMIEPFLREAVTIISNENATAPKEPV
jgi:hypothetical protein